MSLTTRILLLVLLALAPALVIQGYNEVALRKSRDEAVRADALATARAVAGDFAGLVDSMRQALDLVSEDPSVRARDPAACTAYLRRADARLPHVIVLALTEPDGTVICDSAGSAPGSHTNGDRAYHRRAVEGGVPGGGVVVGGYAVGTVTGRPSLHFARAIHGPDGAVASVLSAGVDLDWLSDHLQQSVRQPSTAMTITDRDGVIIARRPDGPSWIGRRIPPEREAMLAAQGDGARDDRGLDGRRRIIATVLPGGALAGARVVAGRDRAAAFADIDAATRRGLVLIALGVGLALAAALVAGRLFIRRPFERLLRTAAAWQAGDLTARTGLSGRDEFGRLGSKLDAMAGTLQRNEGDLRAEIRRGHALQEQQVTMLHELNHRVKNTLATVQALARQSAKDEAGRAGPQLEARILSLSKTHDLLTRADWSGAPLAEVLENELAPYRAGSDHIVLDGPDVSLPPRHVLALGMTIHELTTNAAKYGALSVPGGRVGVTWSVAGAGAGRRLRLAWRESGGPPVAPPTRAGFGTRLIAGGVRRELAGEVDLAFDAAGLRCTLDVPLEPAPGAMLAPTR
ncbi:HWE histidine kinase domain-containing protein [Methylobacterium sp. NEAU 140]|uniref:sensor histidine kinase n=1 Tax=Methylobacterium sp. NEAU 140 TaxID=3064945 RepID=UPI0027343B17|nr:HWE histidine kinase domain-containing protein [Methylobacterium sp. NEAU 140]MDP4022935.1 HWE histidine kinase domain-containing protein [Methylobacterium sp. NEAU 140]